jgi:hypothetical protein
MEREHIVLLEFNSISDGVDYMSNQISPFSFCVGRVYYNNLGEEITLSETPDIINLKNNLSDGYIHIDIHEGPVLPGDLYVSDGFMRYYKLEEELVY